MYPEYKNPCFRDSKICLLSRSTRKQLSFDTLITAIQSVIRIVITVIAFIVTLSITIIVASPSPVWLACARPLGQA